MARHGPGRAIAGLVVAFAVAGFQLALVEAQDQVAVARAGNGGRALALEHRLAMGFGGVPRGWARGDVDEVAQSVAGKQDDLDIALVTIDRAHVVSAADVVVRVERLELQFAQPGGIGTAQAIGIGALVALLEPAALDGALEIPRLAYRLIERAHLAIEFRQFRIGADQLLDGAGRLGAIEAGGQRRLYHADQQAR